MNRSGRGGKRRIKGGKLLQEQGRGLDNRAIQMLKWGKEGGGSCRGRRKNLDMLMHFGGMCPLDRSIN